MSSTIYTMGTALRRAHDNQVPVALLVEGHWVHGQVAALDGHGVVLATEDDEHSVVRMERVSAVRVMAAAPGPDVPAGAPQPSPPVVPPVVPPQAERRWGPSQTPVPA